MGKITIQDLASVLVERWQLGKKEASMFVNEMFFLIQKSLDEDKIVKVKGLGTFKIIDVDDRESVDVNTGDRVLIEGHGKITFTPDALMKELVNKPFSQFETVVLNEGVDFDAAANQSDEAETAIPEETEDSAAPLVEFVDETRVEEPVEPVIPETPEAPNTPEIHENLETPIKPAEPEPVLSEPVSTDSSEEEETASEETPEETVSDETQEETEEQDASEEPESVEEESSFKKYLKWIGLVLLALAVFLIGYLAGRGPKSTTQEPKAVAVAKDSVESVSKDSATIKMDAESEEEIMEDDEEMSEDEEEEEADDVEANDEDQPMDKWEAMDARVKTGAYRILGTDTVVKAKAGDNLTRIGNRLLGPGMECYLEVYNGLSAGAVLSAGQEIKIPKVELKKKKKKIE